MAMNPTLIKATSYRAYLYELQDTNGNTFVFRKSFDLRPGEEDIYNAKEEWHYFDPKGYWVAANPETPILQWLKSTINV